MEEESVAQHEKFEELAAKYEELKAQVEQHFETEVRQGRNDVTIVKAPHKPTKEQWERHQASHTPYEAWCKHCLAARVIRGQHPSKGRRSMIVPDVEAGINGPVKVSIDYMYLRERVDKYKEVETSPPQLEMVEHRSGRVWAYRVPNKGVLEGVAWFPERIVQDLNNAGHETNKIQ